MPIPLITHTHTHSNIVFQGQLYYGEAKSKSWSPVCSGQVTVNLQKKDEQGGVWQLVAFKGVEKVRLLVTLLHTTPL